VWGWRVCVEAQQPIQARGESFSAVAARCRRGEEVLIDAIGVGHKVAVGCCVGTGGVCALQCGVPAGFCAILFDCRGPLLSAGRQASEQLIRRLVVQKHRSVCALQCVHVCPVQIEAAAMAVLPLCLVHCVHALLQ
jgi:hypothetical protein